MAFGSLPYPGPVSTQPYKTMQQVYITMGVLNEKMNKDMEKLKK